MLPSLRNLIFSAVVGAVGFHFLSHTSWMGSVYFGVVVAGSVWLFEWWQRHLTLNAAWLAMMTQIEKETELHRFKQLYLDGRTPQTDPISYARELKSAKSELLRYMNDWLKDR